MDCTRDFGDDHANTSEEKNQDNDTSVDQPESFLGFSHTARRKERSLIFHLLYAAEGFEYAVSLNAIVDNFNRGFDLDMQTDDTVVCTAQMVIEKRYELDEAIKPFLANWRFERVSVNTKLILRLAFWELLYTDMASTVVINEAIELAKCYAETDAYRFINGVLDSFVKKRESEAEK